MAGLVVCLVVVVFLLYLLIRNHFIFLIRGRFIDFFYEDDPDGYSSGKRFHEEIPSYDEMLWKFWVWPLSKFYQAYRNRNRKQ